MKLLFLCHRLPYPPRRGGKIRPFNMIKHLAQEHEVTVATVARSRGEVEEGRRLREFCRALHVAVIPGPVAWSRFALHTLSPFPATFAYFYSPWLARTVHTLLARPTFDAIFVHSSSMGPYVANHSRCRKIIDFGDADSEKWFQYARTAPFPLSVGFRLEGVKVRRYERRLAACFDGASVISDEERRVLVDVVGRPIEVIPNGVDLEYFQPSPDPTPRYKPHRLVFTGNMGYRANVDAAKYLVLAILPRLRTVMPDVELHIVGMDPTVAVRRLADGRQVVVTGRVADVRPYLREAAAAVAPLRVARGLQNKVLEAMAMRVPVVATPAAIRGLNVVPNRDARVAADPDEFARALIELMRDPIARERFAEAGRAYVEQNHDWTRLLRRLDDLLVCDPLTP